MRSTRFFRLLRALARDRDGVSAIELAICLPLLVGMLVPMIDLGMGAYMKMQLANAVHAGAEYAAKHGFDQTAIESAVTNATAMSGIQPDQPAAPAEVCHCVDTSGSYPVLDGGSAAPCTGACASGTMGTYVVVNAQASYSLLFPYPGLTNPVTLTAQSVVRIQ
jgi:Flp pilus assembly protein TadG